MQFEDFAPLVVALVALIALRDLTRPARIRRALKDDVAAFAALPEGHSKTTMQRLVDEEVGNLWSAAHPNWGRRVRATYGLALMAFAATSLGLLWTDVWTSSQANSVTGPVSALAAVTLVAETAWTRYKQRGLRGFFRRKKRSSNELEERRPKQDEHDGA